VTIRSTTVSRGTSRKGFNETPPCGTRALARFDTGRAARTGNDSAFAPRSASAHPGFEPFDSDRLPNGIVEAEIVVGMVGMLILFGPGAQKRRMTRKVSSRNSGCDMLLARSR
jgi:hypothetical protein